jgi:hypothetical protein
VTQGFAVTDSSPTIVDRFMSTSMKAKLLTIVGALIVIGAVTMSALYYGFPVQLSTLAGLTRNYLISWSAPPSTITTESNAAYKAGPTASTVGQGHALESGQSLGERCRICIGSA